MVCRQLSLALFGSLQQLKAIYLLSIIFSRGLRRRAPKEEELNFFFYLQVETDLNSIVLVTLLYYLFLSQLSVVP